MVDIWRPLSSEEYNDVTNHMYHTDAYSVTMNNIKGYEDRAFMLRMTGRWSTSDEAIENAKYLNKKWANDNSKLVAYKCTHCNHYHLTTKFKKIKYD